MHKNKTIVVKGGGSIYIPERIIKKEFPQSGELTEENSYKILCSKYYVPYGQDTPILKPYPIIYGCSYGVSLDYDVFTHEECEKIIKGSYVVPLAVFKRNSSNYSQILIQQSPRVVFVGHIQGESESSAGVYFVKAFDEPEALYNLFDINWNMH